jgi:uncharacterized membrane protein
MDLMNKAMNLYEKLTPEDQAKADEYLDELVLEEAREGAQWRRFKNYLLDQLINSLWFSVMAISFIIIGWQVGVHWTYPLPADNVFFGGMLLIMGILFAVLIILYAALYPLRNLVEKLLRHIQHKPDNNQ